MSLRNRPVKKDLSSEDIAKLKELNEKKAGFQRSGLSPEQVQRAMAAEETVFAIKNTSTTRTGNKVSDGFEKVSDIDAEQGIVIHNPVTRKNEGVLSRRDGQLYNVDGSLHPATVRLMKKYGL